MQNVTATIIEGGNYQDDRGGLVHINDFDMTLVKRMYQINPADTNVVRGWQAHKKEIKWFYCVEGSISIQIVKVDDFDNPSGHLAASHYMLRSDSVKVLRLHGGHATAIKSREKNSKLLVFSNFSVEESKSDDYRYPLNFWTVNWEDFYEKHKK